MVGSILFRINFEPIYSETNLLFKHQFIDKRFHFKGTIHLDVISQTFWALQGRLGLKSDPNRSEECYSKQTSYLKKRSLAQSRRYEGESTPVALYELLPYYLWA